MFNLFRLFLIGIFTNLLLTSCGNETEATSYINTDASKFNDFESMVDQQNADYATKLNNFLAMVDQQNADYAQPVTLADIPKWGGKFFSAVVDGCVGTVAGATSCGAASWLFGTAASWLYDEYWDNVTKTISGSQTTLPLDPDNPLDVDTTKLSGVTIDLDKSTVLWADTAEELSFIDSIGYYHNEILSDMAKSGKKYIEDNGDINFSKLTWDVSCYALKYGLDNEPIDNDIYKAMTDFTLNFVKELKPQRTTDFTICFNNARKLSIDNLAIPTERIDAIKSLCQRITSVMPYLAEGEFLNYSHDLNLKIKNSDLPDSTKNDFKTLNNIIANSSLYWGKNGY